MRRRKCGTSSASRLPTASYGLQRKHGTGGSGLGPVKEPPLAGNFRVSLAPATSPRCYSKPATMATTDGLKAKKGRNFSSEEERQLCRSWRAHLQRQIKWMGWLRRLCTRPFAAQGSRSEPVGRDDGRLFMRRIEDALISLTHSLDKSSINYGFCDIKTTSANTQGFL
jgi:hypothetical protein